MNQKNKTINGMFYFRMCLVPVCALVGFFISALIAVLIAKKFGFWEEAFAGFFAAFSVVISTYAASPIYKKTLAVFSFFLGAFVSSYMLQGAVYPEHYPLSGSLTYIPLISTCIGGLMAIACSFAHHIMSSKKD